MFKMFNTFINMFNVFNVLNMPNLFTVYQVSKTTGIVNVINKLTLIKSDSWTLLGAIFWGTVQTLLSRLLMCRHGGAHDGLAQT